MNWKKKISLTVAIVAVAIAAWIGARTAAADTGYSLSSLNGSYGYMIQGTYSGSTPLVGIGVLQADGQGNISGSETSQFYGQGSMSRTYTGSYAVNPDGTGTVTLNYAPSPSDPTDGNGNDIAVLTVSYSFVIVNSKAEFHAIRSDNGAIVTASFTKQ
jgi:hypothetical protein